MTKDDLKNEIKKLKRLRTESLKNYKKLMSELFVAQKKIDKQNLELQRLKTASNRPTLLITPVGWPCRLYDTSPGFFCFHKNIGFKTNSGQVFDHHGNDFKALGELGKIIVQPVLTVWEPSAGFRNFQ